MGHELDRLVECYSGGMYAEHPRLLRYQGEPLRIEAVEVRWRTPEVRAFEVRVQGGRRFRLAYSEAEDTWQAAEI